MEEDLDWSDKFFDLIPFGGCSTNGSIEYIQVLDLDDSIIKIPFIS